MNIVALTGNLVKDIELKYSQSGVPYTSFTLAVRQEFKSNGEYKSDFITCKAFNKTAQILADYTSKGSKIGVRGSIRTGSYEKDGNKVYTTDVNVDSVELLSPKQEQSESNYQHLEEDPFSNNKGPIEVDSSDLPF